MAGLPVPLRKGRGYMSRKGTGGQRSAWKLLTGLLALAIGVGFYVLAAPGKAGATSSHSVLAKDTNVSKYGELDCNGFSPIQRPVRPSAECTDIRGFANVHNAYNWDSRFFDNGHYIGHDEPDMTFNSSAAGSGGNVTWTETIGKEPTTAPSVDNPGHDSTHWFQLSVAPWYSMAMCDSNSYPQLPCTPNSDANAASCANPTTCSPNSYPGAGSAVMEMQFYPPGDSPFVDNTSCDNTHWCAALDHRQPRVHLQLRQLQHGLRRAGQLRLHPDERRPDRAPQPAARRSRHGHSERPHAAHQPGRQGGHPHVGRPRSRRRRGESLQGDHRRPDDPQDGVDAGVGGERFPEHLHRQLRRDPVQLRARVQHCQEGQHQPMGGVADQHQH